MRPPYTSVDTIPRPWNIDSRMVVALVSGLAERLASRPPRPEARARWRRLPDGRRLDEPGLAGAASQSWPAPPADRRRPDPGARPGAAGAAGGSATRRCGP